MSPARFRVLWARGALPHRAILFVEGPLDVAVLDEYAGGRLDAAGVSISRHKEPRRPYRRRIHRTAGDQDPCPDRQHRRRDAMDRSNRKRSSEEIKLVRLITRFEDQGRPLPTLFGVAEDALLFALPAEAIRSFLNGPFPEWRTLVDECRAADGLGPSDSAELEDLCSRTLPTTTQHHRWRAANRPRAGPGRRRVSQHRHGGRRNHRVGPRHVASVVPDSLPTQPPRPTPTGRWLTYVPVIGTLADAKNTTSRTGACRNRSINDHFWHITNPARRPADLLAPKTCATTVGALW